MCFIKKRNIVILAAASLILLSFSSSNAVTFQTMKQDLQENIIETSESIEGNINNTSTVKLAGELVIGRVNAERKLNVRKSPGGDIIDGFLPGKLVEIIGREGEWYRIRYKNDSVAYVHTSLIAVETGTPEVIKSKLSLPASGTVMAEYKLNVRRMPWGEIIDGYAPGVQVEIIGCEGEWYIIKYDGNNGIAYVHSELIRLNNNSSQSAELTSGTKENSASSNITTTAANTNRQVNNEQKNSGGGISGPEIPIELMHGLEAAKRSEWMRSHKCLQFAGTVAHEGGAPSENAEYTQPQSAYPPDKTLRGYFIDKLPEAIEAGQLLPGMLIHVKIHYDKDPAYHVSDDAHHWFIYMGKDEQGVPRFADNTHKGNLQTASDVYKNMKGWANSKKYGDEKYGYVPRVTAVHDPFASVR